MLLTDEDMIIVPQQFRGILAFVLFTIYAKSEVTRYLVSADVICTFEKAGLLCNPASNLC